MWRVSACMPMACTLPQPNMLVIAFAMAVSSRVLNTLRGWFSAADAPTDMLHILPQACHPLQTRCLSEHHKSISGAYGKHH